MLDSKLNYEQCRICREDMISTNGAGIGVCEFCYDNEYYLSDKQEEENCK